MKRRNLLLGFCGTLAAPLAARAQQKTIPTIGFLSVFSPEAAGPRLAAFRQGLAETGYVEDRNLRIEYRWGKGRHDRLPALAADLVGRGVDVIAAFAPPAAHAAKGATATIPIVFGVGTDPVREGLVASLARPGGNMTGVGFLIGDLEPKRLELLSELVPAAKIVALLTNPTNPDLESLVGDVQKAAGVKNLQLDVLRASTPSEIDAAFTAAAERRAGALMVGIDSFFTTRRAQVVALAAHHAIPAIYAFREFVSAGGLISYGTDIAAVNRQMGIYVGKILDGAKPADLPVEQPTRFELVINLSTAKALGLAVPQSVLDRADEVFE